jgi:hypothetical protein
MQTDFTQFFFFQIKLVSSTTYTKMRQEIREYLSDISPEQIFKAFSNRRLPQNIYDLCALYEIHAHTLL